MYQIVRSWLFFNIWSESSSSPSRRVIIISILCSRHHSGETRIRLLSRNSNMKVGFCFSSRTTQRSSGLFLSSSFYLTAKSYSHLLLLLVFFFHSKKRFFLPIREREKILWFHFLFSSWFRLENFHLYIYRASHSPPPLFFFRFPFHLPFGGASPSFYWVILTSAFFSSCCCWISTWLNRSHSISWCDSWKKNKRSKCSPMMGK